MHEGQIQLNTMITFNDFQGPCVFSVTFQVSKKQKFKSWKRN